MSVYDCGCRTRLIGCLQCGAAVCSHCAIPVESATYCRSCARTLLDAPDGQSIEPFEPP
jgi:hypothetical protein